MPVAMPPRPVDLSAESVAGEEDPGASIDLSSVPGPMAPGDQAPAGTPGTGEDVCPQCGGTGQVGAASGNEPCPHCAGTGKVIEAVGGG